MALLCTAAIVASVSPLSRPTPLSPLSPYRRPVVLSPVRLAAELNRIRVERKRNYVVPKLGQDVEIRAVRGRGNGLFAMRDFECDEIIARYSGVFATTDELEAAKVAGITTGAYVADSEFPPGDNVESRLIDAFDSSSSGIGRYVNHSIRKENCYIMDDVDDAGQSIGVNYMVTLKPVRAGSEFFLNYGSDYWDDAFDGKFDPVGRFIVDYL